MDVSQLKDVSSNPWIQVNVAGQGEELSPNDNHLSMNLLLEAKANIELFG